MKIGKDENDVSYNFLLLNKKLRTIVFSSPRGIQILSECPNWQASGKFHIAHENYYQLYKVEAWFMGRMVPCVFCLMHRRRVKDFELIIKYFFMYKQKF